MEKLYPPVTFPVSVDTPMIAPLIRWDHSQDWYVISFDEATNQKAERDFKIKLNDADYENIVGHKIDGRFLIPATSYIMFAWKVFSSMHGLTHKEVPVELSEVKFLRATTIKEGDKISLTIVVQRGSGKFEITEGTTPVAEGYIKQLESKFQEVAAPDHDTFTLHTKDVYQELLLRGYQYSGDFKSIMDCRIDALSATIEWKNDYVPFMDCLLQVFLMGKDSRSLYLPVSIDSIKLDHHLHEAEIQSSTTDKTLIKAVRSKTMNLIRTGGIEIQGINARAVNRRRERAVPVLESYEFVPFFSTKNLTLKDAGRYIVQLLLENVTSLSVRGIEIITKSSEADDNSFRKSLLEAMDDLPLVTHDLKTETVKSAANLDPKSNLLIIVSGLLKNHNYFPLAMKSLKPEGFLISREASDIRQVQIPSGIEAELISSVKTDSETILIFKPKQKLELNEKQLAIKVSLLDKEYTWMKTLKENLGKAKIHLFSQNEMFSGILGLVNCIRKEPGGSVLSCYFIDDEKTPEFDIRNVFYKDQLEKNLAINIYRKVILI